MLLTCVTIIKYTALELWAWLVIYSFQWSFQAVFGLGYCCDCGCDDMTEGKSRYFLGKLIKREKQDHPLGSHTGQKRRRTRQCTERPLWHYCNKDTLSLHREKVATSVNAMSGCTPAGAISTPCFSFDSAAEDTFWRGTRQPRGTPAWAFWHIQRMVYNCIAPGRIQGRVWAAQEGRGPLETCQCTGEHFDFITKEINRQIVCLSWDWASSPMPLSIPLEIAWVS